MKVGDRIQVKRSLALGDRSYPPGATGMILGARDEVDLSSGRHVVVDVRFDDASVRLGCLSGWFEVIPPVPDLGDRPAVEEWLDA